MTGYTPDCDDWRFISEISSRFPSRNIMDKFHEFMNMPAPARPQIAVLRTNFVDREGWNELGIKPRVQSLQNHVDTMLDMLQHLSPDGTDIPHLAAIIEIHDLQEVITSDFTWDDPISKAEKIRLERLAINIIFECHPKKITLWEEYTAKRTDGALWINDIDKMENIYEFEVILSKNPSLSDVFNHWKQCIGEVLKTDLSLKVFNYIDTTTEAGVALSNKHARIAETGRFMNRIPG